MLFVIVFVMALGIGFNMVLDWPLTLFVFDLLWLLQWFQI